MRLTHIKLAGFKSFVEPTSFAVPSRLVGVVGPNGCGKSNIIDAVRWVLGESKASELRGESMQDVIFNGSTNRKPASRSSVELVFDNQEGRAGGNWNQFTDISVKRVLTRDGNSTYYINQQPVRRRDVQDIFLGTGLGPRAYAIIGQGMIARLIEARPEDLRVFLEEAAGVSKYKERRRETENRLSDTRDNLTRVQDILRELNNNIEKLAQQAEIAQQYRSLDSERTEKQQLLWLIRLQDAQQEHNKCAAVIEQAKAELEGLNAQSIRAQTELILLREHQVDAQQSVDAEQQRWMEINRQVSKLEADLRVMAEARLRLSQRVAELMAQQEQWRVRLEEAQLTEVTIEEDLLIAQEREGQLQYALEDAQMACEPVAQALEVKRAASSAAREASIRIEQDIKSLAVRRESASRTITQLEAKRERLLLDQRNTTSPDEIALADSKNVAALLQTELAAHEASLPDLKTRVLTTKLHSESAANTARAERDKLTAVTARLEALRQLHERLEKNSQLNPWLKKVGLESNPRILQKIRVETGWERAFEAVLRERLAAFEVSNLDTVAGFANTPPTGAVAFIASSAGGAHVNVGENDLAAMVQTTDVALKASLHRWLHGVKIEHDLPTAIAQRQCLRLGECYVTPQGHVVTTDSVMFYAEKDETAGGLARLQEMDNLDREVRALHLLVDNSESERVMAQAQARQAEVALQEVEQQIAKLTRQLHEAQMHLLRLNEAAGRAQQKLEQLTLDLSLLADDLTEQQAIAQSAEDDFAAADEKLALAAQHFEDAQDAMVQAERTLRDKQTAVRDREREAQEASFAIRALQTKQANLSRDVSFAQEQGRQIAQSLLMVKEELLLQDDEHGQADLQMALDARVTVEQALSRVRAAFDDLSGQVRQAEEAEREAERQAAPLRENIQELILREQAARLTIEQFDQLLIEAQADREQIAVHLSALTVAPRPSVLQGDVTRLTNALNALGSVNLAALDELNAASERKLFLDQQSGDLHEAIETLEDAIRRIDKETRGLLEATFNTVNGHFGRLFPLLFGGGEAKLVMSGEEILDAGVQVFAQPPGKKNGTIHLLSGGEKALTATALVFAIFELNPAPFCLLDEVDAPLDDANTERFCRLVKKMSEQTQFLFISHNKIAMEMAEQLIGVTMQEKGVSRIVAVDLASAKHMATETV